MNSMFLALALALTPIQVSTPAPTDPCASMGSLAASIMEGRQDGVPMSALMDAASQGTSADELAQALVRWAYSIRRFQTAENQHRAVQDFQIEVELICYRATSV